MATYAAMVAHLDTGVGRIMSELKSKNIATNTLVLFLSDNGACDEIVHPFYYDVPSRTRVGQPVKVGNDDHAVFAGPNDVWQSYGVPWANVSDTPFRLYKHYTHEGGIASPLIVYWPEVITNKGVLTDQIGHITDLMPTLVEIAGATYPKEFKSKPIYPMEGQSILPALKGQKEGRRAPIFWEHEGNRAIHLGKWKLVSKYPGPWELYDMENDRTELHDLAAKNPFEVTELARLYDQWADRCGVVPPDKLPREKVIKPAPRGETAD
jgi:arylsulfatase